MYYRELRTRFLFPIARGVWWAPRKRKARPLLEAVRSPSTPPGFAYIWSIGPLLIAMGFRPVWTWCLGP